MKKRVYVGLGTNQGNKKLNLKNALVEINCLEDVIIKKKSSIYVTAPWGKTDQDEFLNQVVELETGLDAHTLLHKLQDIEIKMGRQRKEKWGPRIIDLDILLYGDEVIHTEELIVPHPYMGERLFVLVPLREISPELVLPDSGTIVGEVLDRICYREGTDTIKRL